MKVTICSFACNDKFPLDIQHRQFQKYIKDADFEFIIFNDAFEPQMEKNINTICSFNKIACQRVPQSIHAVQNPSECYAQTLNWTVQDYAKRNGCEILVLLHSDVFPLCNVSIEEIIGSNVVASTVEFRLMNDRGITYLYPAFTIINMSLLKNSNELDFGLDVGLDVGGKTKDFIKDHPDSVKFLANHQAAYFLATLKPEESFAQYFKADIDICRAHGLSAGWIAEGFYHYLCGSQWNSNNPIFAEGHQKRMNLFLHYFY